MSEQVKKAKKEELKVPKVSHYGTGKRKSAIAKVWLFEGNGEIIINNKKAADYLSKDMLVETILKPLKIVGIDKKYSVKISALGGGIIGQADAAQLGVSRAIIQLNPEFRLSLKTQGLLTRDSRIKERKKYGRKKARKGFQFRKR